MIMNAAGLIVALDVISPPVQMDVMMMDDIMMIMG